MKTREMQTYPINLHLAGAPVLVVGAGHVGMRKIQRLLAAGAQVMVCEPQPSKALKSLIEAGCVTLIDSPVSRLDLQTMKLVFACTNDAQTNRLLAQRCADQHILCNVIDNPKLCSFTVPSVVSRPPVQIAISTGGHAPSLSKRLRQEMEAAYGDEYGAYAQLLGDARSLITERYPSPCDQRTHLIHATTASYIYKAVMDGWTIDPHKLVELLVHRIQTLQALDEELPLAEIATRRSSQAEPERSVETAQHDGAVHKSNAKEQATYSLDEAVQGAPLREHPCKAGDSVQTMGGSLYQDQSNAELVSVAASSAGTHQHFDEASNTASCCTSERCLPASARGRCQVQHGSTGEGV